MSVQKSFLASMTGLLLWFTATFSLAQTAPDHITAKSLGAGADLVVTSVSGPGKAILNQTMSVTYQVTNNGDTASGGYQVDLYLSKDTTIKASSDRLLRSISFTTGLAAGETRQESAKISVPINGLSGKYYFGAVVGGSSKASAKRVSIVRYTLGKDSLTVKDHKTGLMWQQSDEGQVLTWDAADSYCKNLVHAGYKDWRLPRMDELVTIIDYSRYGHAINPVFECQSYSYWSKNTSLHNADYAWHVVFYSGYIDAYVKTNGDAVRCVRGGPW